MIAPRWCKAWRDLADAPFRAALAVSAMAAGVFGLGAILTSYAILGRELDATYEGTHPASTVLTVSDASDAAVALARAVPGVRDAEARAVIHARIRVGEDEWVPLVLFVVRDFEDLRLDTFVPGPGVRDSGAWPPANDAVLLERTALSVARAAVGDTCTVKAADSGERTLLIAGTVHAAGLAPAWMEHAVTGFVGWSSVTRGDFKAESQELRFVVAEDGHDEAHIREVASRVESVLEASGADVLRTVVPPPGRHPHADQMDTFLFLLGAFGALTLALSAVLVANMIHALLTKEVKQVGVMKAVGASTRQVAALYLGEVSILAVLSLCIGMPLGTWAGFAYTDFAADMLNATIASWSVPAWVIAAEIAIGIAVPLSVALVPVVRASRITVHRALNDEAGRPAFGSSGFDRWLAEITWLPRPFALSLRSTMQRRARLTLTLATLAAGGAVFISAWNVSAAWTRALDDVQAARPYDLEVRLAEQVPLAPIADAVARLPDVVRAEYWSESRAELVESNGAGETRVNLVGPDAETELLDLPIVSGRWLRSDDEAVAVINQHALARDPALHLDGEIVLRVRGETVTWPIVGIVKELMPVANVYAPSRAVRDLTRQPVDMVGSVRIVSRRHDAAAQLSGAQELERAFDRLGVRVAGIVRLLDHRRAFEDHLLIIVSALMLAAALMILVGGLGLLSTLTLNVNERTREIGVLGAIGATPRTIARHLLCEGVLIGVASWCLAVLVAVPITFALASFTGQIFIKARLDFFMSPLAAGAWLAGVAILAALASFYPARRAARLTVREALSYA